MKISSLCTILFLAGLPLVVFAQNPESPVAAPRDSNAILRIETSDGNVFIGPVVSETAESIVLRTPVLGEVAIRKQTIRSMTVVRQTQMVDGEFWEENAQGGYYFFNSSAYGLRKGQATYQNVWVILNQVNMGVSDHVSIAIGIVPLFVVFPVWVAPSVYYPVRKDLIQVGVNGLFGYAPVLFDGSDEGAGFGFTYGQITYGPPDRHISVGMGCAYAEGSWNKRPMFAASGMVRTGRKFAFVTENYLLHYPDFDGVFSLGCRFIGRRVSLDAALWMPLLDYESVAISPWLGIRVQLGKG